MNKIVVGIDQSYQDTGITIAYNNKVKAVTDVYTKDLQMNVEKRKALSHKLHYVFKKASSMSLRMNAEAIVIIERIRLQSQGFLNINYIKGIGALNAMIVDIAYEYGLKVYSVDTRAWKSAIVGNSKGIPNRYGIDEKKWPTIMWCNKMGYKDYIINYDVGRRKKGIIIDNGKKYTYNDNRADSICICLYGFIPESKQLLEEEH